MESQGHSTGSLVGKGNFYTKFSNTGTILREMSEYKKKVPVYRYPFKIRDWIHFFLWYDTDPP